MPGNRLSYAHTHFRILSKGICMLLLEIQSTSYGGPCHQLFEGSVILSVEWLCFNGALYIINIWASFFIIQMYLGPGKVG